MDAAGAHHGKIHQATKASLLGVRLDSGRSYLESRHLPPDLELPYLRLFRLGAIQLDRGGL